MTGEGGGAEEESVAGFLFSPPLPLPPFFFSSRSNFRAITRLETLATQANLSLKFNVIISFFLFIFNLI